jgi:small subunit ribosomal protein S20
MPHTKSAKKRLRQNEKRRLHNRAVKKSIKLQLRKVQETAAKGSPDKLREELNLAVKKLDKAAARRIIHPNLAARKKSQLARLVGAREKAGKP